MVNGKKHLTVAFALLLYTSVVFIGCAPEIHNTNLASQDDSQAPPPPSYNGLKHRLAIAVFDDKSGFTNNLFGSVNELGTQSSAILASHLIKSGEFVIIERQNFTSLEAENKLQGNTNDFVGVSALIFGAITEFGSKTEYIDQGIAKSKIQTAHAKVTIRLVDPLTGVAFYSEFGEANVSKETNQVLGFGKKSEYDGTISDKALNAAISKLVGNVLSSLRALPWRAPILEIQGDTVFIGAGKHTGLTVGKELSVIRPGNKIKNPLTKAYVELPGSPVGKIKVISLFGNSETDEGAICIVTSGNGFNKTDRIQKLEDLQ